MTITKYKTQPSSTVIEAVEVLRETEQCVYVPRGKHERREFKATRWDRYHDSWEDAHQYLMSKAERKIDDARRDLQLAQSFLGNVKGLRKPR